MPKFIVTLPALSFKYIEVEAKDSLWALMAALSPTVYTEEEWNKTIKRLEASNYFQAGEKYQRVNVFGDPA